MNAFQIEGTPAGHRDFLWGLGRVFPDKGGLEIAERRYRTLPRRVLQRVRAGMAEPNRPFSFPPNTALQPIGAAIRASCSMFVERVTIAWCVCCAP